MKKIISLFTFTLLISLFSVGQTLKIDNEKALVNFNFISEKTTGTVKGIKATIVFDAKNLSISSFSGTADVTTLSTENKMRDTHLQQEDMFDAKKFPTIDFSSSSIENTEKGFTMSGEISIKGTKKKVTINFTYEDNVFIGKTSVYSNDFDVFTQKNREDSKVLVKITIPII
jgi:polyisoprenoid-binding protein YceI